MTDGNLGDHVLFGSSLYGGCCLERGGPKRPLSGGIGCKTGAIFQPHFSVYQRFMTSPTFLIDFFPC